MAPEPAIAGALNDPSRFWEGDPPLVRLRRTEPNGESTRPTGPAAELPSFPRWPAQRLLPQERQELAVQILAGAQPVSDLALEHGVSRKVLYQPYLRGLSCGA